MMLKKSNSLILAMVMFFCGKPSKTEISIPLKFRLPRNIVPVKYDLEIFPELNYPTKFKGKVRITVECKESTNKIILHQDGLMIEENVQIKQIPVVTNPPSIVEVEDYGSNPTYKLYIMKLKTSLNKSINYEIEMKFSGIANAGFEGLIAATYEYTGTSGYDNSRIAFTRMDKFGARQIFPCFDELGMKAKFTIRIGRSHTMNGFSNASFNFKEPASSPKGWFVDEFNETVLMEASAVAIVVVGFPFSTKTLTAPTSKTEIRVLAPLPEHQLEYIGLIARNIFQFFCSRFDISYGFKKLDIFVVNAFPDRVLSSYGVIYMSETSVLLAWENQIGIAAYETVSDLCHVISKQWIGYAVTMWSLDEDYIHTALNLFFQTVCVTQISSSINPDWVVLFMEPSIIKTFLNLRRLRADQHQYGPILSMGIDNRLMFDYGFQKLAKAFQLFRMINVILGENIFKKSITNYLKKFQFGNSSANDIWDAFTNTAMELEPDLLGKYNLNFGDIVRSWIKQTGYPLITIIRNNDTKKIHISQKPFYPFGEKKEEDELERCWYIPLNYTTKSKSRLSDRPETITEWSTCKGPIVMEIDIPRDEWILFDLNVSVIGRINYDESNWDLILKSLVSGSDPSVFDGLTRARLISDLFALAEVGEVSYKIVLNAMKYLSREVLFEIFNVALWELGVLYKRLLGTDICKSFEKHVRKILDPVFNREEFKNLTVYKSGTNVPLKINIIRSSCGFGVKACSKQSRKIITDWKKNGGDFPNELMIIYTTIHCEAIKHGNQKHWDFMWKLSKEVKEQQKNLILSALACTTSERLLMRGIFSSKKPSMSHVNDQITFNFVRFKRRVLAQHVDKIVDYVVESMGLSSAIVYGMRYLDWSINKNMVSSVESAHIFHSLLSHRKGYNIAKKFFISHYQEINDFHQNDVRFSFYWSELLDATVLRKHLSELESLAFVYGVDLDSPTKVLFPSYAKAKENVLWFERSQEAFDEYFSLVVMFVCGNLSKIEASDPLKYRLPRNIMPVNYDLEIFPELNYPPKFKGKVIIKVECKENTNQIILHQDDLKIEENVQIKQIPVVTNPPSIVEVEDYGSDLTNDLYIMKLKTSLEKDINYEIELKFSGNFYDRGEGLVVLSYPTIFQKNRIAYTSMDKFGARRIFPCFDELGMKATFTIRIGRSHTSNGFSNASFSFTEPASSLQDWFIDEFKKTVIMEASAVAIVVAGFPLYSKTLIALTSKTDIRILASLRTHELDHINSIAINIYEFFLDRFKIPYAFKKLDVFVLRDFSGRALSSYGVIYISENTVSAASENRIGLAAYEMVSELCHVMSKQWIGYGVTVWNLYEDYVHTALNLFLQTVCVVHISSSINSDWAVLFMESSLITSFFHIHQLYVDEFHATLLLMGLESDMVIDHGFKQVAKAFYLFRMMHVIFGDNIFEKSITNYLKKFQFGNSSANDLWDAFTNTAMEVEPALLEKYDLNVGGIARSWINQTGYPLVTIIRNDDTKKINIIQKPFYSFGEEKKEDEQERCWFIPLNYTTKSKSRLSDRPETIREWSTCKGPIVMEIDIPRDEWILFDINVSVIGRINYDESNWDLIQKSLVSRSDPSVFDGLTRARLISDLFALAEVGELSYKIVLDAMKYLSREVLFDIFMIALGELDNLYTRLIGTYIFKPFQKHVRKILDPVFNREEFKNLTELDRGTNLQLKKKIIESSCKFGVTACWKQSQKIIKDWKKKKGVLPDDKIIYDTIHCEAIKHGNQKDWDFMWKLSKKVKEEERKSILAALACTTSTSLLKGYLDWSINGEMVSRHSLIVFCSLLSNRKGYNLAKKFFISNYEEIYYFHQNHVLTFSVYWTDLFDATVLREDLYDLENLALSKGLDLVSSTSFLYRSYERAKTNVLWFERSKEAFDNYFSFGIFNWRL